MVLSNIFSSGISAYAKETESEEVISTEQSMTEELSGESSEEIDLENSEAVVTEQSEQNDDSTDDEIVYKDSVLVNGVDVTAYSEEEIEELLCTAWGFGLTAEEIRNVFDMSEDEFVEYRKSIKISRWEVEGYFDDIVLSEMVDLAGDEDFLEWVSDEQLEEWFGMDRESFETLGKTGLMFESEYIPQVMNIDNGGTISRALFKGNVWSSWRHNWYTSSKVNSSRSTGLSTSNTFKQLCVNNFSTSYDCSAYVSAVLRANGEFSSGESYTSADFATALKNKGYKDVSGKVQLIENGAYTSAAKSTIQSICSGDILVWYYQQKDGTYVAKHVSIGYIYDGEPLTSNKPALETLETGEVCVYQSNGGSPATCDVESVAYYLSGANSSSSYGTVLQIFRKNPIRGSVSVEKTTTNGDDLSGNVFSLYKVSCSRTSYLNAAGTALSSTPNLSSVTDTASAEDGVLTKIATFTTNSSGVGVPQLTTIISNAHKTASVGGDWYNVAISGNTITGLPLGDYIIIEDKATTDKTCWEKGGTYGGKTLDDTTVRCSITTKNGSKTTVYNGITSNSINSLADFGLGQGLQYYSAFTIDNIYMNGSQWGDGNTKSITFNNENNNKSLKLKKTSSNTTVSSGNSCYSIKGAVYAVYNNVNNNGYDVAAKATKDNYTTLTGYVGALTTDENGATNTLSGLKAESYYVKEVISPKGYGMDNTVYTADLSDATKLKDNVYTLSINDAPQMDPIDILLYKTDGEDKTPLSGAEFTIKFYAGEYEDGVNPAAQGASAARSWVIRTDSTGYAKADNSHKVSGSDWYYNENGLIQFPLGTITIQETKAPNGYKLDSTVYVRRITSSGTAQTVTTYNAPTITDIMYRKLTLVKTSANTSLSGNNNCYSYKGAVYAVYDNQTSAKSCNENDYTTLTGYVGALTTKEDGTSNTLSNLLQKKYYVKEVIAPKGYALDTKVYTADLTTKKNLTIDTYTVSSAEQPKSNLIDIVLNKTDKYTGEAISDAEFTVKFYAGEYADGVNPEESGVTATRSWVIKTDSDGNAKLDAKHLVSGSDFYYNSDGKIALPLGTVTIQETKAPDDYMLDEKIYVKKITDNAAASVGTVNSFKYVEEKETPKRKPVEFYKLAETNTTNVYNPLAGAGFMVANVNDLEQDADGNYIWDESKAVAFNDNGTEDIYSDDTKELFTDAKGYAKSVKLLNGTYLLHESTVPENYTAIADQVFTISTEEYSDVPLYLGYYSDNLFKGYLRIVKKDSLTGKNILNTDGNIKFKIWSYDEEKYVSFSVYDSGKGNNVTTDEFTINNDGLLVTPGTITSGKYRLEEINTTDNYYSENVSASYDFTINNKTLYEQYVDGDGKVTAVPVFTIEYDNTPVYGRISIHKVGEYYDDESGETQKKDVNLKGVTFDIVADEDIMSGDGQTLLVTKDTIADTLVTDKDGNATSKDLPLGKYHISERDTVDGYYAMEDVSFELSISAGITTSDLGNGTQKKSVDITKELVNYKKIELKTNATDANSGIKNANAEKNATIYDDVYCKNLVVGKTYTIKGKLYDKETGEALIVDGKEVTATKTFKADNGIMTVRMEYNLDASELAGKQTVVFEDLYEGDTLVATHSDLSDKDQTIKFPKLHTTAYGKENCEHLVYPDEEVTIVDKVEYTNLIIGTEYTVDGVLMNKKTGEELTVDGKTITASTTFTAEKSDGYVELEFTFNASALNGESVVVFEDCRHNDITVATHKDIKDEDQTIHFAKIGTVAKEKSKGTHETMAADKYEIVDTVSYENIIAGRTYIVKGVLMDKSTGIAVVCDGEEVAAETEFIAESESGSIDVEFIFGGRNLAGVDTVVFEELYLVPEDEAEDDSDIQKDNDASEDKTDSDETENTMSLVAIHKDIKAAGQSVYIDYTKVKITKVDSETGETLCGADLSLYDEDGNLVDNWITEAEPHAFENILPGNYILVENVAPDGYALAETLKITIEDIPEVQTFTMEDDVIKGSLHVTKVDSDNQDKKLSGVKFMLFKTCETVIDTSIDKDFVNAWEDIGNEERETINGYKVLAEDLYIGSYETDDNGEFWVEGLTYGTYYLVETETQKGYTLVSDITGFIVDEENPDNDIVISNEGRIGWITYQITTRNVPSANNIVKTGDNKPIILVVSIMLLALAGLGFVLGRKKLKKAHLIIPLVLMLVPVVNISASAKENTETTEYVSVDIESYVDSEYATSEPAHAATIDYTYTYPDTGKTYKVQLPYTGKKMIESGYVVPVTLTGTIYDYDAEYFLCNGVKYENPGDDISKIENILLAFINSEGYSADSYQNLSYEYSGGVYTNSDGLVCRDYKVTFDTYGVKYRFYYGKTFDDLVCSSEVTNQSTTTVEDNVVQSVTSPDVCSNAENENILENELNNDVTTSSKVTTEISDEMSEDDPKDLETEIATGTDNNVSDETAMVSDSTSKISSARVIKAVILIIIICALSVALALVIRNIKRR